MAQKRPKNDFSAQKNRPSRKKNGFPRRIPRKSFFYEKNRFSSGGRFFCGQIFFVSHTSQKKNGWDSDAKEEFSATAPLPGEKTDIETPKIVRWLVPRGGKETIYGHFPPPAVPQAFPTTPCFPTEKSYWSRTPQMHFETEKRSRLRKRPFFSLKKNAANGF